MSVGDTERRATMSPAQIKRAEMFSRLPKWAQAEITRLERDVAHWQEKHREGPEDSDTFADPYSDAPRPLGAGTTIQFNTDGPDNPGGHTTRVRVRVTERGTIDVNGGDAMSVLPRSSNSIEIVPGRFT